jgi:hypothetical protein
MIVTNRLMNVLNSPNAFYSEFADQFNESFPLAIQRREKDVGLKIYKFVIRLKSFKFPLPDFIQKMLFCFFHIVANRNINFGPVINFYFLHCSKIRRNERRSFLFIHTNFPFYCIIYNILYLPSFRLININHKNWLNNY